MGGITSRINFESLNPSRRRSHQDEPLYSYSLNKNYFSNYFFMGGERFEVSDPDYLFGDSCDLNFLSCTKPCSLPYKKAQQNLIANLNSKQKATNKSTNRVNVSLTSPLNILTSRHRQITQCQKQDAQTQTLNSSKSLSSGPEPSQPLVMLINIRKETLRLVKSSNMLNNDSDLNSLSNNRSPNHAATSAADDVDHIEDLKPLGTHGTFRQSSKITDRKISTSPKKRRHHSAVTKNSRLSPNTTETTEITARLDGNEPSDSILDSKRSARHLKKQVRDSDTVSSVSSPVSSGRSIDGADADNSSSDTESIDSSKSGYTSVKDMPPSCASDCDEDDENFEDALNDTANLSSSKDDADEEDSDQAQQQKSLLRDSNTKDKLRDIRAPNSLRTDEIDESDSRSLEEGSVKITNMNRRHHKSGVVYIKRNSSKNHRQPKDGKRSERRTSTEDIRMNNRVYNIEFHFDTEVDCCIRIYYFCTREVNANGVTYKPQHATYKSRAYVYKRGLNQKFEQQEHTFQPYLFDEDLLIYKPLDSEGNYNSGAVFPIVIHCSALDGKEPRQSQSLVATVEKSQLDESYSIKPLKQLVFVDGVQYILQDIYGIEHKSFPQQPATSTPAKTRTRAIGKKNTNWTPNHLVNSSLRSSMISIGSNNVQQQQLNSDTASIASGLIIDGVCVLNEGDVNTGDDDEEDEVDGRDAKGSLTSIATINQQPYRSLTSENNSFECVICMSEERDTMLLPCRHLCLCSSCAQSLRYQANSCPICRCPFKAALNLRIVRFKAKRERRQRGAKLLHQDIGGRVSSSNARQDVLRQESDNLQT